MMPKLVYISSTFQNKRAVMNILLNKKRYKTKILREHAMKHKEKKPQIG